MKNIKVLIDNETLQKRIKEIAKEIENDYTGKEVTLVCILKGSIMFFSDLIRNIDKNIKLDFIRISSYDKYKSGEIKLVKGLLSDIKGKNIILVEDIIDTGKTMNYLISYLEKQEPNSIKVCTLLDKPSKRTMPFKADYVAFEVDDKFIVGYGLDFNEDYRNLNYVGYIEK